MTQVNTLPIEDLRKLLRKKETRPDCWNCNEHPATDVHHIDGNHRNNSPDNLAAWCKRCHNDHHGISDNLTDLGISVRQLYAIQNQRRAMANRLLAYRNLGYEPRHAKEILNGLVELEKNARRLVTDMVEREPIYQSYLRYIRGCGPALSAVLASEIGDIGRFPTISSLWAYCGLDVRNGAARKRKRGETANWNSILRMTCAKKLTDQFIKLKGTGTTGRRLYDEYKNFYTERDGDDLSKGHIDNRARRKVTKVFLSCLWVEWRKLKGLPISKPYAFDKLTGHTHIVTPEDWIETEDERGWMDDFSSGDGSEDFEILGEYPDFDDLVEMSTKAEEAQLVLFG